jgi:hypothetical protein
MSLSIAPGPISVSGFSSSTKGHARGERLVVAVPNPRFLRFSTMRSLPPASHAAAVSSPRSSATLSVAGGIVDDDDLAGGLRSGRDDAGHARGGERPVFQLTMMIDRSVTQEWLNRVVKSRGK